MLIAKHAYLREARLSVDLGPLHTTELARFGASMG